MRLGTSNITAGHNGSSQSIADTKYTSSNHPFLKGNDSIYNINNPKLGMLENFIPQVENTKKFEGLEYFTKQSPRHTSQTSNSRTRTKKLGQLKSNARYFKQKGLFLDAHNFHMDPTVIS